MSDIRTVLKQHTVDQFWHKYLFLHENNAILGRASRCFRNLLVEYIAAHTGVKLPSQGLQRFNRFLIIGD